MPREIAARVRMSLGVAHETLIAHEEYGKCTDPERYLRLLSVRSNPLMRSSRNLKQSVEFPSELLARRPAVDCLVLSKRKCSDVVPSGYLKIPSFRPHTNL